MRLCACRPHYLKGHPAERSAREWARGIEQIESGASFAALCNQSEGYGERA